LSGKTKRIHMLFLVSPVEIQGKDHVEAIKLVKNELQAAPDGSLRARATEKVETLPVGLVFRSIGYMGVPLPGLPFDQKAAVIPNDHGRVVDPESKQSIVGEYVVGWIKRGPTGVIGTNKPDAVETVNMLVEDMPKFAPLNPVNATQEAVEQLIKMRKPNYVSYPDWRLLDELERQNGELQGRPRVKFSRIEDMLSALEQLKV
jgi:ferredoxin--NADP+ reductase